MTHFPLPPLFTDFRTTKAFVLLYDDEGIALWLPREDMIKLQWVEEEATEATVRRGWRVWVNVTTLEDRGGYLKL